MRLYSTFLLNLTAAAHGLVKAMKKIIMRMMMVGMVVYAASLKRTSNKMKDINQICYEVKDLLHKQVRKLHVVGLLVGLIFSILTSILFVMKKQVPNPKVPIISSENKTCVVRLRLL